MPTRILAVDDSAVSLRLISQTLSQAGFQVFTISSGAEALKQLDEIKPEAVLLDVAMPEMDGYEVCRQIRHRPATAMLPIVMLTAQNTVEEKIKGYGAGADDYVTKPFEPAELQVRVKALLRRAAPLTPEEGGAAINGKTIGLFSLRGGVGTSTLAVNLAAGLAQVWCCPTALVDLAFVTGHDALMLNISPRTTWADLAPRSVQEIDTDLVEQILSSHTSGVRILAAPRRVEQCELLTPEKVSMALEVLKQRYQYVVLDLAHDFSDLTLAALDKADEVLLLVAPELASVVNVKTALEIFDSLGYPKDKVRLVLNRTFERHSLAQSDLENALNHRVNVVIPFAPDLCVPALNSGAPPVLDKPNTEWGALFEDLAFYVGKEEHRAQRPPMPTPAWQRVANRAQRRKK